MPQLNKQGKFVFGWSKIQKEGIIQIPPEALKEYNLLFDTKVIGISGSKKSGAFSVSSKQLLENSILSKILDNLKDLKEYTSKEGTLLKYKGRYYFWLNISETGTIRIPLETLNKLDLNIGDNLLVIRGSNIAFDFAIKGPLYDKGLNSDKKIDIF